MIHHKRTACRVCGGTDLRMFLALGPTPLANSFLSCESGFDNEPSYPLDVYFCDGCSLVQLLDVIDPEVLFRDYIYVTGTSDTIAKHNVGYAQAVVDMLDLGPNDTVVEVASNDGSLLERFRDHGVRTLGVEPATNIAEMARAKGIETVNEFFNGETALSIRDSHGPAKAVIGNNVLAHVDELKDFFHGFKRLLSEDGLAIVEVPYLGELLDGLEYDTIYHEHLCYFSVNSLIRLCDEVGLSVARIDKVPVHGGSLRVYAGRRQLYGPHADQALDLAEREKELGMTSFQRYAGFAERVEGNRAAIKSLLQDLKSAGKTVAGYGAPAKGNTLLNYCGIDTSLIPYTVDKSDLKVGKFTPGMHLPVLEPSALLDRQPDYVMILAWNFAEEIMKQQNEYRARGGKFIIPVPEPQVI